LNTSKKNDLNNIILYDGVCNLCHASVRFVVERDKNKIFSFAGLQSEFSKKLLSKYNFQNSSKDLHSIILLKNGKLYRKSSAALRISQQLNGLWPLFGLFLIIPSFIRDAAYLFIAQNRYKWFGKKEVCEIPLNIDKKRFLDLVEFNN
jgi:predicted DCC family thiol-disulfide oxidoreductase YuxK|tara:strand:- start:1082 stop:1525 length:444 start_codon:yes stop_codon:yes gene_type:complete